MEICGHDRHRWTGGQQRPVAHLEVVVKKILCIIFCVYISVNLLKIKRIYLSCCTKILLLLRNKYQTIKILSFKFQQKCHDN